MLTSLKYNAAQVSRSLKIKLLVHSLLGVGRTQPIYRLLWRQRSRWLVSGLSGVKTYHACLCKYELAPNTNNASVNAPFCRVGVSMSLCDNTCGLNASLHNCLAQLSRRAEYTGAPKEVRCVAVAWRRRWPSARGL